MKTRKTARKNRTNFVYVDAEGNRTTLRPGMADPVTGEVITEEWIQLLHRMDDREVDNNLKQSRRPVASWEKAILDAWKTDHPYDDLPSRAHLSLDLIGEDDDGEEDDMENGSLIAEASILADQMATNPMVDRLREVVEMLRPDQQELYQRIVIDGESLTEIAIEQNVSVVAIHNRLERIKRFIKKNF